MGVLVEEGIKYGRRMGTETTTVLKRVKALKD